MKSKTCPACGAEMKRNGKTKAGAQRWRCKACGGSATHANDVSGRELDRFFSMAALQGEAARHARRRPDVQAPCGALLEDMARPRARRRDPPGRPRRRHPPVQGGGRARGAERRARALMASGQVRDLARLREAAPRHRPSRDGRHRRRAGVRQGGEGGVARHPGPKMPLPRVLPGEALHDLQAEAPGGSGALLPGQGPAACGEPPPGGALDGEVHGMVRVLVRLPRGEDA